MLKANYNRDCLTSGRLRVVRLVLCDNHGYLTYAGECGCSAQHDYDRYAVAGTTYGPLHTISGDMRLFTSENGARAAMKRYAINQGATDNV